MPRWLPGVLKRIRVLAAGRRVRFTLKARRELAVLEPGLDERDACELLGGLTASDSVGRRASLITGEWMYIFKPSLGGALLYVKLILRGDCIVLSLHEDEGGGDDEQGA